MAIFVVGAPTFALACAALAIEAAFGYPPPLFNRIGHPVTWIGRLIGATDTHLNGDTASPQVRRLLGVAGLLLWLIAAGAVATIAFELDTMPINTPVVYTAEGYLNPGSPVYDAATPIQRRFVLRKHFARLMRGGL